MYPEVQTVEDGVPGVHRRAYSLVYTPYHTREAYSLVYTPHHTRVVYTQHTPHTRVVYTQHASHTRVGYIPSMLHGWDTYPACYKGGDDPPYMPLRWG